MQELPWHSCPGSLLTLSAGAIFGVVKGTLLVSIGSTLAAAISFLLGRFALRGWIETKLAHKPVFKTMIGSLSIAMTQGIGLGKIANCIHPCPTQGDAVRKVGDLYNKTRLTPRVASIMRKIISWQR